MPMQRNTLNVHHISGHYKTTDMKDLIVRISAWLLCLIGFGSSVACSPGMVADEYGSPYASFEVKGKVTDQQGVPIPGIQVICDAICVEPAFTESDGSYHLSGDGFPREKIEVEFKDVTLTVSDKFGLPLLIVVELKVVCLLEGHGGSSVLKTVDTARKLDSTAYVHTLKGRLKESHRELIKSR